MGLIACLIIFGGMAFIITFLREKLGVLGYFLLIVVAFLIFAGVTGQL